MKALLRKSLESTATSFVVKELREAYFDPNGHFHPQYQLFLVLSGTGTRFIGDHIQHFEQGDLVLMGPDLPHLWRSDRPYFQNYSDLFSHGIVIYFTEDFAGKGFFDKPEMAHLKLLLERSRRGIEVLAATRATLTEQMRQLLFLQGFERFLGLLHLLHALSMSEEYRLLAAMGYSNSHKVSETERMQKVHQYVMHHFTEVLHLDEVASLAGMAPSAFCRYFKARTNRTFSNFVSEIRIGYACKLLIEEKLNVTQICYESGFRTVSNFNRQFRELTGKSPLQYQKEYVKASVANEKKGTSSLERIP